MVKPLSDEQTQSSPGLSRAQGTVPPLQEAICKLSFHTANYATFEAQSMNAVAQ